MVFCVNNAAPLCSQLSVTLLDAYLGMADTKWNAALVERCLWAVALAARAPPPESSDAGVARGASGVAKKEEKGNVRKRTRRA